MAKSPGTNGPKRPNPTTPPSDKTPSQSNLLFRPIVRRGGGGGGRAPSTKDVIIALNRIISKHARKGERPVMELPARGLLRYIDLNPPYRTPDKPRRDRVAGFLLRRSSRSYDDLISRLFSGAPGGGSRRGKTSARLMKPKRTIGAPPALDRRAPWFSHTDISWRSYTKIFGIIHFRA